jgi:uncharacterized protein
VKIQLLVLLISALSAIGAEVIPPVPSSYFNDYAHVVSAGTAQRLNQQLEEFERASGNQIVLAVYPKMQSDSSLEDYTVRVAQAWKVGQKSYNNGAVLFVFIADRKMFLQVGYGLEGALPDARCKQIIENEIKPRFRAGDYGGGLTAGVTAIIAATKGEYKGTGHTVYERKHGMDPVVLFFIVFICVVIIVAASSVRGAGRRGWTYNSGGVFGGGYSGAGGGGFSGGGFGGGFSGGGGSFGGGGAGGSW